jgi:hypothetical protein
MTPANPSHVASGYDLVVFAATPGGIACALRAAREGLRVLLVERTSHVGGMWASGVQILDTRYAGHRCPLLSEFLSRLEEHYRTTKGEGSPDHAMARFGDPALHGQRPRFEPRVAEQIFRTMLAETPAVTLLLGHQPLAVQKAGTRLEAVTFERVATRRVVQTRAEIFVDASYEADLAALAGAAFRIGREGADEFDEPHAGRRFTTIEPIGSGGHELARSMNLHYFNRTSRRVFPGSTGEADAAIQAYSVRLVLTNQPENRRTVTAPPGYSRERYVGALDRSPEAHARGYPLSSHLLHGDLEAMRFVPNLPNGKMDWLGANLVGGNHHYPHAGPAQRQELYRRHVAHALGLLYFLQHDAGVPAAVRAHVREWGLARDEYQDNDNIPPLMYVREARRLAGRKVFTEHDASRHPRHGRTPIHLDSVAFAEWPMDSHDCHPIRQPGSCNDGEFILAETTLPSQVPFRAMLSEAVDNLIVPVALSASHVGWGTLRLETVLVHTGEAAGVAAALCLRDHVVPAGLGAMDLQAELLRRRIAITYFADVDLGQGNAWTRDVQFLGARGFFPSYAAGAGQPMGAARAVAWVWAMGKLIRGERGPDELAASMQQDPGATGGVDEQAMNPTALALLTRHGWTGDPNTTVQEAVQVVADAVRTLETAGCPM